MTAGPLYLIATLVFWLGLGLGLRALALLVPLALRSPGVHTRTGMARVALFATPAALCLLGARAVPDPVRPDGGDRFSLPLVWVSMGVWGWAAVIGLLAVAVRLAQGVGALSAEERRARLGAAIVWGIVGAISTWLHVENQQPVTILRGTLPMGAGTAAGLLALAAATVAAMTLAARASASRGFFKSLSAHLVLITGSIVFGIPFAWLIVTSLKEDRDIASQGGLVWVPKVSQTVDYMDPKEPWFQTTYQGRSVVAKRTRVEPDGRLELEIQRPLVLRGTTYLARPEGLRPIPREVPIVKGTYQGAPFEGKVIEELIDARRRVQFLTPQSLRGQEAVFAPNEVEPVRTVGFRWRNYPEALEYMPPETMSGLLYLRNTLVLVVMSVLGTVLSSALVAFGFSRLRFPGREAMFKVLLSTMMLPAAVTLLPTFLIFRSLGWIDTLLPLWVPAFFASAFNVFLLRQFFMQIPNELEDASKIDGCGYLRIFWSIMLPQIKPALAVVAIWTFMGAWNNFMGPLIYISSPDKMPIAYALQLFQSDRSGEPGLLMAAATMAMLPVLLLFFFAQRYFIEGATLSGLGGR